MIWRLLKLAMALMERRSTWNSAKIPPNPVMEGYYYHRHYRRFDPEFKDGFHGVRVIDLIAALMDCDPYDVVTIGDEYTGVDHIELISGIPLMDLCDCVAIITDKPKVIEE